MQRDSLEGKQINTGIDLIHKNIKNMVREVRSVLAKNSPHLVFPKVNRNNQANFSPKRNYYGRESNDNNHLRRFKKPISFSSHKSKVLSLSLQENNERYSQCFERDDFSYANSNKNTIKYLQKTQVNQQQMINHEKRSMNPMEIFRNSQKKKQIKTNKIYGRKKVKFNTLQKEENYTTERKKQNNESTKSLNSQLRQRIEKKQKQTKNPQNFRQILKLIEKKQHGQRNNIQSLIEAYSLNQQSKKKLQKNTQNTQKMQNQLVAIEKKKKKKIKKPQLDIQSKQIQINSKIIDEIQSDKKQLSKQLKKASQLGQYVVIFQKARIQGGKKSALVRKFLGDKKIDNTMKSIIKVEKQLLDTNNFYTPWTNYLLGEDESSLLNDPFFN